MSIQIFDAVRAERVRRIPGAATARSLAIREDVVAAAFASSVRVWTGSGRHDLHPGADRLTFAEDGRLVGLTRDGYWIRDVESPDVSTTRIEGATRMALSPRGARVAAALGASHVVIYDTSTGLPVGQVAPPGGLLAFAVADDGRVATLGAQGGLRLDEDEEPLGELQHGVSCIRFSPDGQRLLVGGGDWTVHVYDLATPDAHVALPQAGIHACFTGDGAHVVAADMYANRLQTFDAASGARVSELRCGSYLLRFVETDWNPECLTGVGNGFAVTRFDVGARGTGILLAVLTPLLLWLLAFGAHLLARPLPPLEQTRDVAGLVTAVDVDGSEVATLWITIDGERYRLDGPFHDVYPLSGQVHNADVVLSVFDEDPPIGIGGSYRTVWQIRAGGELLLDYHTARSWRATSNRMGYLALGAGLVLLLCLLWTGVPHLLRELGLRPFGRTL